MSLQSRQLAFRKWATFLWWIVIILLFSFRYSADQRFTLFFLNKAFANTAVIFIAASFLMGPLCIVVPALAKHLAYRRYIGVFGFLALVLHVVLSVLQWNDRFPYAWYVNHKIGVTAATIAFVIFAELALTSENKLIKALGPNHWKFLQRIGYLGLILGLFHVSVASADRWEQWFEGAVSIPNSLIVFYFGICIIFIRLLAIIYDAFFKNKNK